MNKLGVTLLALATLGLAACQSPQQQIAAQEKMMSASGFKVVAVNTPERQAAIRQLPPNKFARERRDGRTFYLYPDPTVCNCLFVGDQKAYGTYNFNALQKNIADEQEEAAAMLEASWNWGPWGGFPEAWYY